MNILTLIKNYITSIEDKNKALIILLGSFISLLVINYNLMRVIKTSDDYESSDINKPQYRNAVFGTSEDIFHPPTVEPRYVKDFRKIMADACKGETKRLDNGSHIALRTNASHRCRYMHAEFPRNKHDAWKYHNYVADGDITDPHKGFIIEPYDLIVRNTMLSVLRLETELGKEKSSLCNAKITGWSALYIPVSWNMLTYDIPENKSVIERRDVIQAPVADIYIEFPTGAKHAFTVLWEDRRSEKFLWFHREEEEGWKLHEHFKNACFLPRRPIDFERGVENYDIAWTDEETREVFSHDSRKIDTHPDYKKFPIDEKGNIKFLPLNE